VRVENASAAGNSVFPFTKISPSSREDGDVSETCANFQRARRNFLILIVVVVIGFLAIEIWNLYFYLERPSAVR
jgi:hypothetical protein